MKIRWIGILPFVISQICWSIWPSMTFAEQPLVHAQEHWAFDNLKGLIQYINLYHHIRWVIYFPYLSLLVRIISISTPLMSQDIQYDDGH
mgnify:CR=1 FL=1